MSDETLSEVRPGQRIAKAMARAGLCSRRDAEAWIAAGRVTVNGKALDSPAYNVTDADDVRVDGEPLAPIERTRLFLFHKPRGLVTTARDPEGRPTIFDALPAGLPRLVAVGRLDINTEGLLLLTNDGGLARALELPSTGWLRRYRVRAHGTIDEARLDALSEGVTVDGVAYAGIEARLDREQGSNVWLTMGLREGKNREIKKVLDHLGLAVNRLIRISFGPFELRDLAEGEVAEVRTRILRDQLGVKLAKEAGVDFDAPIIERQVGEPNPEEGDRRRAKAPERRERRETQGEGRRRFTAGERRPGATGQKDRRGPPPSAPERKRKHVSALRAEIAAEKGGPRKRVERSATQDRKGRSVAVERISTARAEATDTIKFDRGARKNWGPKRSGRRGAFEAETGARSPDRERKDGRAHEGRRAPFEGRAKDGEFPKRGAGSKPRGEGGRRFDRPAEARDKRSEKHRPREQSFRREEGDDSREERRPGPVGEPRERDFRPVANRGGEQRPERKPGLRGKPQARSDKRPPRKGPPKGEGPRRPPRKR
ncbi:MAG TPA: pseudouridine synthase [Roseiarcus sp.]|nr:pseudouridine synthase [Roseiarcus sp.]